MKPIFIGAAIAGILIALVLVIFRPDSGDVGDGAESATQTASIEQPLEIVPENPDPSNPGNNFSGGSSPFDGVTIGGVDPEFLIFQLEAAGVDIPEGASTEELAHLLDEAVRNGFVGFAP